MKIRNYFFLLFFFIFSISISHSQSIDDIIRVSSYYNDGTARFNAMGGAFASLGGDLSAISINPASSSIFTYNEFGITIGYDDNTIKNNLNGYLSKTKSSTETLNQLGSVWVFTNGKAKFSFAYNLQMFIAIMIILTFQVIIRVVLTSISFIMQMVFQVMTY